MGLCSTQFSNSLINIALWTLWTSSLLTYRFYRLDVTTPFPPDDHPTY
ncbi:2718_t:CDS:1, partial [Acaulospora colombiana]